MTRSSTPRLRRSGSPHRKPARLALEDLESRDVPTLFTVDSPVSVGSTGNYGCVATGDFTGNGKDGLTDLVMTNQGLGTPGDGFGYGNTITILLPTGNGTFKVGSTINVGTNVFVTYVAVGDLNGDGIPDLAVLSSNNDASGNLTIFLGNGNGGFTKGATYATGLDNVDWVGIAPMFAGSTVPSIVVSAFGETTGGGNGAGGNGIDLYQGNGDGTFNLTTTFSDGLGFVPNACALGYFSGSSNIDIAVAEPGVPGDAGEDTDGIVEILLNNGSGAFTDGNSFDSGGYYPTGIATTQFTSSGRPDLVVANAGDPQGSGNFPGSSIGVLINTGGDNFNESTINAGIGNNGSSGVFAVATGDFNQDGNQDIVAVEYGNANGSTDAAVLEYAGDGQGNFTEDAKDPYLSSTIGGQFLAVGSFNDSSTPGVPDVVICTADSTYDVYLNTTTPPASTTTTVTSTPASPITFGTSITFTATVSGDPSVGTVTFYAGPGLTNEIGSPVDVSGGTATSKADTTLPVGTDTITAVYSGGTGFEGSQGTESVVVNAATTTTVSSSPIGPITLGTSITFMASISGDPSVGTVTFYAGPGLTNEIGSAVNVSSGTATSAADTTLPLGSNTITAVYSGGTGFAGSQGTETVVVNNPTTTTVTSTPTSPISVGTSITFTATISGDPSVGTVTFYAGPGLTNEIGSAVDVSSGTATSAADTTLPAGTDTITAVYSGGTDFAGSQGTENVTVNSSSTVTVTSTPTSPITLGTSITFTATISGDPSVGTVTFYAGPGLTNPIGSAVNVSGGTATSSADTDLPLGSNTITAVYSGGTGFAGGQGTENVTVNNATTTTVTSTPTSPITSGTSITFTATISGDPSVGTVTFYAGPGLTNPIGSAVNVSNGSATSAADTTLPVGTDTITAVYSGGTDFAGSQGTESVTVNASTTTTVTSTPTSPITSGTSITFTATVSGSPSVGTVTFYAGPGLTNPIGSPVNVSGGAATSSADTTLPVGTDTITAVYSGGTGFAGSQGTEDVTVNAATTTTVTSTPTSPITSGTSIAFTATISGDPSVGTVTFYAGPGLTNPIGSAVSVSSGSATSSADTTLPVGTDTITAVYSGGTGFGASQGTENVTVNAATTTTVTSTPSSPITSGTSITFTATISGDPSVGTVTFYAGPGLTNPIGSAVNVSGGAAISSADTTLPVGTDTITAVYSGGTGFGASQGTENVTVNSSTTITVTSTPTSPITSGTSINFTATISGSPSVGTVTFYAGPGLTNPIGSPVNVSSGSATSSADTDLPVGTDTITAVYSGGTGFAGGQGTESVTVNAATTTTVTSTPTSPITSGTLINFTATISGSPSVGTVTFYAGPGLTNPIGSPVSVSNGSATSAADTTLPLGLDTITAVYSGGTGFAGSQGTENVTVNTATTTTVTSTPTSPITSGTVINFTATISGSPSVGTVTFYAGPGLTNPIGPAVSVSNGSATSAADTTLPLGLDTITAVYSGGTGFAGSQGAENVTVNAATTTAVTSTPTSPITSGTVINFTATISGSPSVGTVTFYAGPGLTNPIGSPVSVSSGTATSAADTTLPLGIDTITAVYSGGTGFAGSQGTESVVVNAATTTTVTSTPTSPILSGTSITFTATVSGSPSVGTVTFYAGPGLTNPISSANVSSGTATSAADTTLPAGTDTITAVYTGGTGFAGSQGTENVTVNTATTTTVASTPASPITSGTSITFTATISGSPSVGTVTFYAGPGLTNPIGSPASVSSGSATSAADTTLPVGTDTITAVYSGGTDFVGSQGTESVTVNAATTTTVTSTPASPIASGTLINFTATISGSPSVGTVTFYAGPGLTNPIGSPVDVSSGSATTAAGTTLPIGIDTITAVYSGGTGFAGSQGTESVTVFVGSSPTTTTVTSTPTSPITSGTSITFTATVGGSPSVGNVTFYAGPGLTNPIGSPVSVSDGTATSAADTTLPVGTDTITAVYSGGTGFGGSQGTESVTVNNATVTTVTTVTSTPSSPITSGTSISFTAIITGAFPSVGTVTFYAGPGLTNPIGSPVSVSGAVATSAADTTLPVGTNTITAVYSGATGLTASQGTESVTVNAATTNLPPQPILVGGSPNGTVQVYTESNGTYTLQETLTPFGNIPTDVRTAVGDVNGDGTADYIFATGPGTPFEVTVLSGAPGNAVLVAPFDPFLPAPPLAQTDLFTAGGFVSAGDFMANGRDQIVVSPDQSGGPRVAIYDMDGAPTAAAQPYTAIGVNTAEVNPGSGLTRINNFLSVNSEFRGGARTAVGDLNGDGVPDLAIAAGYGGGPAVLVINGTKVLTTSGFTPSDDLIGDFFAFNSTLRDGAYLAIGDVLGNGQQDLILGPGAGGPAEVEVLSGAQLLNAGAVAAIDNPVALFVPTGLGPDGSGMRVAVADSGYRDQVNVVVGAGRNMAGVAKIYPGTGFTSGSTSEPTGGQLLSPFGGGVLTDGIFVG